MGFRVVEEPGEVRVILDGWDMAMTWRRILVFGEAQIGAVSIARRSELESTIDHRLQGFGTHDGMRRPGRRRVGVMLGRTVRGPQFWAVPASGPDSVLVVLDLVRHDFARAVLSVTDPGRFRTGH